uniref:DUF1353 domain-containing protein n=1 Tax=Candidatus Kentrum sp. LFY TaxID=2126342 RepID=A0A450WBZ1_9GAMM|nr:MAG: Protein of unknown function (DUF1353) [Candidatus Kentron sp. LFY]
MATSFTSPVELRFLGNHKWKLLNGFDYHVGRYPSDETISVPSGFETDLASTPRIMWPILPPHGKYMKAAILHDYLYAQGELERKRADDIFLEAMTVQGVMAWKIQAMYLAVRFFGWAFYGSKKTAQIDAK